MKREQKEKKISSLWKDLLSSALLKSEKKTGSVLMFGNPKNGKKSLIDTMIRELGVEEEELNTQVETREEDHIYIMDYKFLRIKQFFEEEDSEDVGKISFYIINSQYPHLKNFLREKIFENLMIMIVLDLSKPGEITHEFIEWITYINDQIMPFVFDIQSQQVKDQMTINFNLFLQKNQKIINKDNLDEEIDLTAKNEELESSFGIPMLICANKMDTIEQLKDEKMIEHLQYLLRSYSIKYGSSLIYTSTIPSSNIIHLAEYLGLVLFNRENHDLQVHIDGSLFIPSGYDKQEILEERFKDSMDYYFQRNNLNVSQNSKQNEQNVMQIQEFLKELKEGNINYYNQNQESKPGKSRLFSSKDIMSNLGREK